VRDAALRVIQSGTPRLLHYDTGADDRIVWGLGLGCNGSVDVFVQAATEALTLEAVRRMRTRLADKSPFAVSTVLDGSDAGHTVVLDACPLDTGSHVTLEGPNLVFTEVFQPPPTLIVCGAGDDARPLVTYASESGFMVTVVDHRQAFLNSERFRLAERLLCRRPEAGVDGLDVDPRTLVIVMTHSLAHDRDWLKCFLATSAQYIGLLGPRTRAEGILGQLGACDDSRVFAPVGLTLGAEGPEQIAISVVAELLAVLSRQQPGHLRAKAEAIHA